VINLASVLNLPYASASVHCCIVSPPYLQARKYHAQGHHYWPGGEYLPVAGRDFAIAIPEWIGDLGRETTQEMYIFHVLEMVKEIMRVLRPDGTLWLNLGDGLARDEAKGVKFAGYPDETQALEENRGLDIPQGLQGGDLLMTPHRVAQAVQALGFIVRDDTVWAKRNCKPESNDGWAYRQNTCACVHETQRAALKEEMARLGADRHTAGANVRRRIARAPQPDCPDCRGTGKLPQVKFHRGSWRFTRSHEYLFQVVHQMGYYADREAVKEPAQTVSIQRAKRGVSGNHKYTLGAAGQAVEGLFSQRDGDPARIVSHTRNPRSVQWSDDQSEIIDYLAEEHPQVLADFISRQNGNSVLLLKTQGFRGNHFATFPPSLVERLLLASCPQKVCDQCGMPWARVLEYHTPVAGVDFPIAHHRDDTGPSTAAALRSRTSALRASGGEKYMAAKAENPRRTVGWQKTCHGHESRAVPGIVLDPCAGSGTVGFVARRAGRRFILSDISPVYMDEIALARAARKTSRRLLAQLPMFQGSEEA